MIPLGANSRMNASPTSFGWISQYTCASRTRRAISCVTCEPKSRMRILSCCMSEVQARNAATLGGGDQPLVRGGELAVQAQGELEVSRVVVREAVHARQPQGLGAPVF